MLSATLPLGLITVTGITVPAEVPDKAVELRFTINEATWIPDAQAKPVAVIPYDKVLGVVEPANVESLAGYVFESE